MRIIFHIIMNQKLILKSEEIFMFIKSLKTLVLLLGIGLFMFPTSNQAQENNPYFAQCYGYCINKSPDSPGLCQTDACYYCTDLQTLYPCVDHIIECATCITNNSQCHLYCESNPKPNCDADCGDPAVVCKGCPDLMFMKYKNAIIDKKRN